MMMKFLFRNNRIIKLAVVIVAYIFVQYIHPFEIAPAFLSNFFGYTKKQQQTEMQKISKKLALYEQDRTEVQEQLGTLQVDRSAYTQARILTDPEYSLYYTFIINKGKDADIEVGDYVVGEQRFLLGLIVEIYQHSALVQMISSPQSTFEVTGHGSRRYKAEGVGGAGISVSVPYGDTIPSLFYDKTGRFIVSQPLRSKKDDSTKQYEVISKSLLSPRDVRYVTITNTQ